MKKFIACILVVIMVMSFTTVVFAADGFTDISKSKYEIAINALYEMGIVDGYTKNQFKPNNTLTRAEAATIMVRALYGDEVIRDFIDFDDVNLRDWFYEYVNTAVYYDIVHGMGHNLFCPQNDITVDQFMTIIINALGYNAPKLAGTWPENVQRIANRLGLYDNLPKWLEGTDAITRGQACQVIYNALHCACVEYKYGRIVETDYTLYEKMGFKYPEEPSKPSDVVVGPTGPDFRPVVDEGQIYGVIHFVNIYHYGNENEFTGLEIVLYDGTTVYKVGGTMTGTYIDKNGTSHEDFKLTELHDGDEIWLSLTFEGSSVYKIDKVVCHMAHSPDEDPENNSTIFIIDTKVEEDTGSNIPRDDGLISVDFDESASAGFDNNLINVGFNGSLIDVGFGV